MADDETSREHRGRGWNLRGSKHPDSGRKPGQANRVTREFRAIVQDLIDKNAENVEVWLEQVANGVPAQYSEPDENGQRTLIRPGVAPDPKGSLDMLNKLAEYAAPKLSRHEMTGPGGSPLAPPSVHVSIEGKPRDDESS